MSVPANLLLALTLFLLLKLGSIGKINIVFLEIERHPR